MSSSVIFGQLDKQIKKVGYVKMQFLNTISVIGFIIGAIALVKGRFFKIKNRKQALSLLTICFVCLIYFGSQENTKVDLSDQISEVQTSEAETPKSQTSEIKVPEVKTPEVIEKKWIKIGSWSGDGIKETENFILYDGQSRINWQTFDNGGIFQIYVYDSGGDLVNLAANVSDSSKDTTYLHLSKGEYYMQINSALTKWKVELEEQK